MLGKRGIVSLCAGWLLRELLCWERAGAELLQGTRRRRSLVLVPLSPGRQRAPSSELECARECLCTQLLLVFLGLRRGSGWMSGGISLQKKLSGIVQGAVGVPVPRNVRGMTGHDAPCSALVDKVVIGHHLGWAQRSQRLFPTQMILWWQVLWGDWDQSTASIRDAEKYHKREKKNCIAHKESHSHQPLLCLWCM